MPVDAQAQPKYPNRKVIIILIISVIVIVYLSGVFLSAFGLTKGRVEIPYLITLRFGCDLKQYSIGSHEDQDFREDANAWLWESHETLMYRSEILSDPKCFGALLADVSNRINPLAILIYDSVHKEVIYQIQRK